MIKYTLLILLSLIFINTVNSQHKINWEEFKEPDGTLLFARIDPQVNIWDSRQINLSTDLTYRKINNLTVLNSYVSFNYNIRKDENSDQSDKRIWVRSSIDYTKYLTNRKGMFFETKNNIRYINQINSNYVEYPDLINSIGFGIGRIEEISTVNQAYRILNNVDALTGIIDGESQEEIFDLARELRELDYQYSRDSRIRRINQLSSFLDYFKDRSVNLNNSLATTQLVDGYLNSRYRPFIFNYWSTGIGYKPLELAGIILKLDDDPIGDTHFGQKASLSVERWSNGNSIDQNLNATSIKIDLMKSFGISNTVRINTYAQSNYFFKSTNLKYAYRIGTSGYYTPNARTGFGISIIYKGVENNMEKLQYLTIDLKSSYYINYDTVITTWFRYYNTDEGISSNNNFNITLNHYFY